VQLDPRAGPAHRAIGSIFFQKGQFDMAREEALTAIELDGLHEGPSFLGTVDKMLGRPDRALRWYTITKHWQTHPADDEFDLADCWADLAGDPQAEAIYRRVAALHPELPEGWLGICRLRLLEGDFAAARAILQANRGSYGDFLFPADMEAQLEFFSRNYSGAERLYARLANKDPNGGGSFFAATDYQSALGCLVTLNGDSDRGREILRRCLTRETDLLRTAPRHPEVLYRLAAVEASLGDKEAAIPHLGEAAAAGWIDYRSMKLDPRFDPIRSDNRYQKIASQMEARVTSLRNSITE
jgi:tetratricopeptide (TPR) repeat protein